MARTKLDVRWSIDARHKIQNSMYDLYRCIKAARKKNYGQKHACLLITGISFSLWRACFLADAKKRSADIQLSDATQFLQAIFSTNTINFSDDRVAWDWSGGFYINNARFRLWELGEFYPVVKEFEAYRAFIKKIPKNGGLRIPTKLAWNLSYSAMDAALENLKRELNIG